MRFNALVESSLNRAKVLQGTLTFIPVRNNGTLKPLVETNSTTDIECWLSHSDSVYIGNTFEQTIQFFKKYYHEHIPNAPLQSTVIESITNQMQDLKGEWKILDVLYSIDNIIIGVFESDIQKTKDTYIDTPLNDLIDF